MSSKVTITRSGIMCADENCGKEIPVGSEAMIYHSKTGRKYYGLLCHEKRKMTSEEYKAMKLKKMEGLKALDTAELNKLIQRQDLTTRQECIELLRKDSYGSIEKEEEELLQRIKTSIQKAQNPRLWKYAWKQLCEEAVSDNFRGGIREGIREETDTQRSGRTIREDSGTGSEDEEDPGSL